MTDAQWLFEYEALLARERDQAQLVATVLQAGNDGLIRLFGLDLLRKDKDDKSYLPLVLLAGRPEVVEMITKKSKEDEALKQATDAMQNDDAFEMMSQAVARGDMDMLTEEDMEQLRRSSQTAKQEELVRLGVHLVEDRPNIVPHVNILEQNDTPPSARVEFDDNG